MESVEQRKAEIDQLFRDLIDHGRAARELAAELETASESRDHTIHHAWAEGISARAIAEATGLSHARIQQIVENRNHIAERVAGLQPALRQRRQDRERSRQLLSHLAAIDH